MGIQLTQDDIMAEVQRMFPREFQIAMLTVTTRKQDDLIRELESSASQPLPIVKGEDASFWDASTEKPVPLKGEK